MIIDKYIAHISEFIEKRYKIVFTLILGLAIFLNLYKIGEVPNYVNVDEAGMTYDAYCIANYGVDRFENKYPVYFINYGDGQNALYTYLTALLIKIAGKYNIIIIRIPSLIISTIEIIVAYLLVEEFKSKKHALFYMLLVTISPWHIMKSRWGLESYLLSPMFLFAIFSLVKAFKAEKKRMLKFFISGSLFGLTLYTYAISYIVIPLFLISMLIYLIKNKSINFEEIIVFAIPLSIFAFPLILMLLVQKGYINEIKSFITIPKLFRYRESELNIINISENIKTLKRGLWCDDRTYNSIPGYGVLYYLGTITMTVGIIITTIKILKRKEKLNLEIIMIFAFFANFVLGFLTDINANKINGIYISATYFEIITFREIYKNKKIIFITFVMLYFIQFGMFIRKYFKEYKSKYIEFCDNGAIELMHYLNRFEGKELYVENIKYTYNIYANPISPMEFNSTKELYNSQVIGYKNFHNCNINAEEFYENAVYVTKDTNKAMKFVEKYNCKMEIFNNQYIILYE